MCAAQPLESIITQVASHLLLEKLLCIELLHALLFQCIIHTPTRGWLAIYTTCWFHSGWRLAVCSV